jgi:single-strand DNA-binding protein
MKSVNRVTLLGYVTRDPEVKALPSGRTVCTFGLATNRVWKNQSGEKQEQAEFHNLVCFGNLADFAGLYIHKGKQLYVEGYLKTRSWENPEKMKIFRTEVVVDDIVLLGPRDSAPEMEKEMEEIPEGEIADAAELVEVA